MSNKNNFILELYKRKETVFKISDIALLFPKENSNYLSERMSYYRRRGELVSPRRGIYAKPNYNPLELANRLYTPSYISLEYVLQQAGIIFQYDSRYTNVSYLSREIKIENRIYSYRRIKEEIIMGMEGVIQNEEGINIATPERAFLDTLYLNGESYFDNLSSINVDFINKIIPTYNSPTLEKRVKNLLMNGQY